MESMEIKLAKLHNTLCLISTKGDDTKIMADCLKFVEQTILELKAEANKPKDVPRDVKPPKDVKPPEDVPRDVKTPEDVPRDVKTPEDVPRDVKTPEENKEV